MNIITATPASVNANRHGLRAPKGGCTVGGKLFKGGQWCLPYDEANPHGVVITPAVEAKPAPIKLTINGFVYQVAEIPAGECGTAAFHLDKLATNNGYDVILNHFGEVACDCPDYEMRKANSGRMCKHGRALVEKGLIPAPAASLPRMQVAAMAKKPARVEAREVELKPLPSAEKPRAIEVPARRRPFVPSDEDFRLACEMFADVSRV